MVLNVAWCCIILVIHVLGMNAIFWFFIWNHLGILHYTCYAQLDCKTNVNGVRDFTLFIFSQFDLIKYIFISNNHNISFEVLCAVSLISSLLFNYRSLILSKQTHTFSLLSNPKWRALAITRSAEHGSGSLSCKLAMT